MLEQVSNFDQEIKFITGFAGSGKSTKLASLATPDTLILTPTHKAASVLIKKGLEKVYTIHATLKLVPTLNKDYNPSENQKMQRLKQIGDTDLSEINEVFIDEFSMISQDILDLLLKVLPVHCKVTIFGDPYQLPPVDGEAIDPLIYTDDIEPLLIQHRAEAPEVVETFMRFMEYIKTNDNNMSLRLNPAIKTGTLNDYNPDTDRILAYTNKKVGMLNSEVAKILGLPESYSYGENLTANQMDCVLSDKKSVDDIYPGCMSKGRLMPQKDLAIAIRTIQRDIDRWHTKQHINHYPTCNISINDKVYTIYYDTDHYHTQQVLKQEVDKWQRYLYEEYDIPKDEKLSYWCANNKDMPGVRERGQAWAKQIAHSQLVFSLQRPFATTIHKSQGSEFSTVYIAQSDIKRSIRKGYYMQYARLMYVALSRAQHRVIIIN